MDSGIPNTVRITAVKNGDMVELDGEDVSTYDAFIEEACWLANTDHNSLKEEIRIFYTCGEEENAVIQSPATYRRAWKSAKSNSLNVILCPREEEQKLPSMEYEQIIKEIGELRDQNIALNNQE